MVTESATCYAIGTVCALCGAIYRVCFVLFIEERRVAKTATRHCSNSLLKN